MEVGDTRFAVKWIAEIEQLPPSGPIVAEPKGRLNPPLASVEALNTGEQRMTFGPRTNLSPRFVNRMLRRNVHAFFPSKPSYAVRHAGLTALQSAAPA